MLIIQMCIDEDTKKFHYVATYTPRSIYITVANAKYCSPSIIQLFESLPLMHKIL